MGKGNVNNIKKTASRQCTGCGEKKDKKELIRVIKTPEGDITVDFTGKKNGRGAYICNSVECLKKAVKKKFEIYSTAYWCIATAIYLGWSFLSVRWDYTWILWPVAGVLFGAVSVVARGIWGTQDSTRI